MTTLTVFNCLKDIGWFRVMTGLGGITLAVFFLGWLLIGWAGWVPTMVDMFGTAGMRTPASLTVGGLLIAAIAFWEC